MARDSTEVRDTSMRIFDTYLTDTFLEDEKMLTDTCWIAFVAAASMILSFKLCDAKHPTTAVSFM